MTWHRWVLLARLRVSPPGAPPATPLGCAYDIAMTMDEGRGEGSCTSEPALGSRLRALSSSTIQG